MVIFQFQLQSAFDKEKLSTESLLKLQTYFGFSWILGCLAFGFIVILKPRGCQITKLYLCIFSLIICGFCCFLADFVQGVSFKEVQIVHRLFLVNCYLLHVVLNYAQPTSNVGGLVIH